MIQDAPSRGTAPLPPPNTAASRAEPVAILLSTYNGARWLKLLLESLLAQTHRHWTLWVRDDGSHDDTIRILRDFAARDPRIRLMEPREEHLGPQRSFSWLLANVPEDPPYLMFCDQDDVWHADKIAATLEILRAEEAREGEQLPLLVHTDLRLVDADMRVLSASTKKHLGYKHLEGEIFPRLLAQNVVTGCTLMVNRSLAKCSLPVPAAALMHDWWIALVAAARGKIVFIPRATIDYRQHGGNASGSSIRQVPWLNGLRRLATDRAHFDELMRGRFQQWLALESHLARFPSNTRQRLLSELLQDARQGRALGAALRHGVAMQGLLRNLLYYYLLTRSGYFKPAAPRAALIAARSN